MNYPIWELPTIGGGSLIALIAILHVYISHLAVGGGAFIWLTDLKATRDNNPALLNYVKKHTWFFLLITMVFGGVSGVGIWFIIALVNPAATSSLIHSFVFGWAIEWVFFVGEIAALLLYHYNFDKLDAKGRHTLAFFYFLFAWLSLAVINGILAFMLTPGKWLETGNFWHGFINPTYFSQLFFRTAVMGMIAGLFGYVTAVFEKDKNFRSTLIRYCSRWLLLSIPFMVVFGIWYYFSLPAEVRSVSFAANPQTMAAVNIMLAATVVIFCAGVFMSLKVGRIVQVLLTIILLVVGLGWMGGFEYTREVARKPYVLGQFMYSTSIFKKDVESLNKSGVLPVAKWTSVRDLHDKIAAGRELFNVQCLSCHTIEGIRNDIAPKMEMFPYMGVMAQLFGQGTVQGYMPPFVGTRAEMATLAAFITTEINNTAIQEKPEPYNPPALLQTDIPDFDSKTDAYVLFVWNDLGMHCISDCDRWFVILPPANTLEAQLIKRGALPEMITDGIEMSYVVETGFENPAAHSEFWTYAQQNFGVELGKNIGLAGKKVTGSFDLDENGISFHAKMIPVMPYPDDGPYNPYPLFTVEAKDAKTGVVLASTRVVAPTSTEMGCRNCHGGEWAWQGAAGVSDVTAVNILKAHDRLSNTNLYDKALKGQPQLCQSCHADPAVGAAGKPAHLNLSAAIHGWHANYMYVDGGDACAMCHPANRNGSTRCLRSLHATIGLECTHCHGSMQEHALGLLRGQEEKKSAARLMNNLKPTQVASAAEVNPRTPWLNEPDCLTCHVDFGAPTPNPSAYNVWTAGPEELYRMRTGVEGSIRCQACHGATHAIYPAINGISVHRDNIQPMQYSNMPYPIGANFSCEVCHKQKKQDSIHHLNMERPVRNEKIKM
ncbi:cytochrome C [candidate division KSB1 bacterium]|nr:cytochrome C [candidate division KSB1 bacterium]